jgi:hypothetical protein
MSLDQAIQDARRVLNVDPVIARLGDGNGNVYDLSAPGSYWVRKIEANAKLSQPFSLPVNPLANIPVADGTAVLLGYDQFGTFCIYSANRVGMLSSNTNPYILNPLDTAVYGKTSQTNLATLYYQRHGNTALFPFTIVVFKAPIIINGIASFFPGAGINVASFVPASGLKCYVCVFIRTDMTLEAFASTPIDVSDLLTIETDVQECVTQSSLDSVIICAYELNGGDATLSPDPTKNVDMRQIVNTNSGASGAAYYQTVQDNGTPVAQRAALNFVSGFTVTDNAGNDSTDIVATGASGSYPPPIDLVNSTYTIATNTQVVVGKLEISGTGMLVLQGTGVLITV